MCLQDPQAEPCSFLLLGNFKTRWWRDYLFNSPFWSDRVCSANAATETCDRPTLSRTAEVLTELQPGLALTRSVSRLSHTHSDEPESAPSSLQLEDDELPVALPSAAWTHHNTAAPQTKRWLHERYITSGVTAAESCWIISSSSHVRVQIVGAPRLIKIHCTCCNIKHSSMKIEFRTLIRGSYGWLILEIQKGLHSVWTIGSSAWKVSL